jgi:hypothetical protein
LLTPEELRALGTAFDATMQAAQRRNEALGQFLSAHADIYVDNQRNSDKITAWLVAQGKAASFTFEDLEQALEDLAQADQLELNRAGVQARAEEAQANPQQYVTEEDMYSMSMDDLRAAAQQAAAEALARRPAPRATDGAGDGSTFNNPFGGNRHAVKGGRRW